MAEVPVLMELLFGEAAEVAERGASERLRGWCAAFEGWLRERGEEHPTTVEPARLAWQRLLRHMRKMPWELMVEDIGEQVNLLLAQGYSPGTIGKDVRYTADFYHWCGERRIDTVVEAGFNPAAGVRRPKIPGPWLGILLSREEVGRLLRVMGADTSALGKRDYAFTLARLRLGAPLANLQKMKWGQIEVVAKCTHQGEEAWVRWRAAPRSSGAPPQRSGARPHSSGARERRQRLPDEVWEAIRAALEAGGRLEGMQAGDYIFAPLIGPANGEVGSKAEDWLAGKHLSRDQLLDNLKLYARPAGIAMEKLTLHSLRRTAVRLRLEEGVNLDDGDDIQEMQEFLDYREDVKFTRYRLKRLPQLPIEEEEMDKLEDEEMRVPRRKMQPFQPGDGMTHGLYARSLPPEQVLRVLKEDIRGVEEEIVGLRALGRRLLEAQAMAADRQERAQLIEAYSLAAYREGTLIQAEEELSKKREEGQGVEQLLASLEKMANELGLDAGEEAPGGGVRLEGASRRLEEEVAAMRCVLRNAFQLAMEAEGVGDLTRLVGIYGSCCMRLVRLLRMERVESSQLAQEVNEAIEQVLKEMAEEYGWAEEK